MSSHSGAPRTGQTRAQERSVRQVVHSTDPRSVAVRERLCAAAEELGREHADISVTSLVRRAGVSRSVFYKHFEGLGDFALYLQRTRLVAIAVLAEADVAGGGLEFGVRRANRQLVAHFEENWAFYRAVIAMSPPGVSERGLADVLAGALEYHLARLHPIPDQVSVSIASNFASSGVASVLMSWLLGDLELEPGALAQHITDLVPPWMRGAQAVN